MAKSAARVAVRVVDRDLGWRKLGREVRKRGAFVTVGIHGEDDSRAGGIGNVELGTVHEFGSERAGIPERSFIRSTLDRNIGAYRTMIRDLGNRVYATLITTEQALELVGLKVASDIRKTISRGLKPVLKPATIAAREFGGTKPLIDRGDLQRSIKHKVFA